MKYLFIQLVILIILFLIFKKIFKVLNKTQLKFIPVKIYKRILKLKSIDCILPIIIIFSWINVDKLYYGTFHWLIVIWIIIGIFIAIKLFKKLENITYFKYFKLYMRISDIYWILVYLSVIVAFLIK